MSRFKSSLIALSLILTIGFITVTVPPVKSIANMYVLPSFIGGEPGTTFKVEIRISGAADVFGWEVKFGWNASVLDFINATEGPFLKGIEDNPTMWSNRTNQDQVGNDTIGIICNRVGYVSGVDGSGILATVAFRVEVEGETVLDLFDTLLADSRPTPFPIEHTATDGFFSNIAGIPIASFTSTPSIAVIGETIVFDASASYDIDGTIERYFWDFGDDSNYSATDPAASHDYAQGGTYPVTLKVTDNEGWNGTMIREMKIRFPRDVAVISISLSQISITIGDPVTITATVMNDGSETATFDVTAYYGISESELQEVAPAQEVSNLLMGRNSTLTFDWKTADVEEGEYRIKVVAETLSGETYTSNNFKWGSEIAVKAPPPFPWTMIIGAVAVVAVFGLGGFFFLRRRRRTVHIPEPT